MNKYIILTAVKNEDKSLQKTIDSIRTQSITPVQWIIASDNSIDQTDDIIKWNAAKWDIIKYIRINHIDKYCGFESKVNAIREAWNCLDTNIYDFVAILDGDIILNANYYERIFEKFENNVKLGIAGGHIVGMDQGKMKPRKFYCDQSVSGGIQVFRRKCFEDNNGLLALRDGGEDWHAEINARMNGWEVRSFGECRAIHIHEKGRRGIMEDCLRKGRMDYSIGSHPVFEFVKCARRVIEKPFIFGSIIRFLGYIYEYIKKQKRPVSKDIISFIRKEQMARLSATINLSRSKKLR